MEREDILKGEGYNIESIWECKWLDIKRNLSNKKDIEKKRPKTKILKLEIHYMGAGLSALKDMLHVPISKHILF